MWPGPDAAWQTACCSSNTPSLAKAEAPSFPSRCWEPFGGWRCEHGYLPALLFFSRQPETISINVIP